MQFQHLQFILFLSFIFLSFRATHVAYGGSHARCWIGAIATGLCHSHIHRNMGYKLHLDLHHIPQHHHSLTHWERPGIEPTTPWFLDLFPLCHDGNSSNLFSKGPPNPLCLVWMSQSGSILGQVPGILFRTLNPGSWISTVFLTSLTLGSQVQLFQNPYAGMFSWFLPVHMVRSSNCLDAPSKAGSVSS